MVGLALSISDIVCWVTNDRTKTKLCRPRSCLLLMLGKFVEMVENT